MSDFEKFMLAVVIASAVCFAVIIGTSKNAETIEVGKVSNSSLHIQCQDEHEPVVTKLANSTEIIVTCQEVK